MKREFYHNETGEVKWMTLKELIELDDYLSWVVIKEK